MKNMPHMQVEHPLHSQRAGRNIAVLCVLIFMVGFIIALTIVKIRSTGLNEGYDHVLRPALIDGQNLGEQGGAAEGISQ